MPLVVPVKFTYASRDLWFDPQDLDILEADYAICSTERGTEIGLVTADPFEVPQDEIGQPLKPVLRVASDIDLQLADDLAIQGDEAMVDFRRLVKELDLEMKPVGVEYLFGGEKAVFYFAAEERVDFRQLVKDLSSTLHIRVDMRQIGVRDETRLVGGYAQCGQELCCTRFGGQFEPVSIRMAKEQDLPLNSSKISGVCGRLMCCLRYEFEAYKDFKSRAPKKKTLIDTPLGKARIQEYDTPREQLVLRLNLPFVPGDANLSAKTARRLLELQAWVAEQSAAGFAPQLGNADPVQETLTAGAARLEQANDEGSAVYTVTLTAHYTMKWSDTFED